MNRPAVSIAITLSLALTLCHACTTGPALWRLHTRHAQDMCLSLWVMCLLAVAVCTLLALDGRRHRRHN